MYQEPKLKNRCLQWLKERHDPFEIILLVITIGIGVFLWHETRKQAEIAEHALILENRAYLQVGAPQLDSVEIHLPNGSKHLQIIKIVITNSGRTPAIHCTTGIYFLVAKVDTIDPRKFRPVYDNPPTGSVYPASSNVILKIPQDKDRWSQIDDTARYYVKGAIWYKDEIDTTVLHRIVFSYIWYYNLHDFTRQTQYDVEDNYEEK